MQDLAATPLYYNDIGTAPRISAGFAASWCALRLGYTAQDTVIVMRR